MTQGVDDVLKVFAGFLRLNTREVLILWWLPREHSADLAFAVHLAYLRGDNEPYCREGGPRAVPLSQPHAATASCEEMPCVESSYLEICGEHERDPFLFLFTSI